MARMARSSQYLGTGEASHGLQVTGTRVPPEEPTNGSSTIKEGSNKKSTKSACQKPGSVEDSSGNDSRKSIPGAVSAGSGLGTAGWDASACSQNCNTFL